jgi:hypothetical protein
MPPDLVSTDEQLSLETVIRMHVCIMIAYAYLHVNVEFLASGAMQSRAISRARDKTGRRGKGLVGLHALVHARKVDVPRGVNGFGVLAPVAVHLLGIVSVGAVRERVVRARRGRRGRSERAGVLPQSTGDIAGELLAASAEQGAMGLLGKHA